MPSSEQSQIDEMSLSTKYPEIYQDYLDVADYLINETFGEQTSPPNPDPFQPPDFRRLKLKKYIVDSMLEAEKSDWFFSSTGRDEFHKKFGFDFPWITEFEQQAQRHKGKTKEEGRLPDIMEGFVLPEKIGL